MKKFLCYLLGHRWLITTHLIPIVGKFKTCQDINHPLSQHRYGYYGFELYSSTRWSEGEARQSQLLHPLAGCKASCERCNDTFDDLQPEATINPSALKVLEKPILLIAR